MKNTGLSFVMAALAPLAPLGSGCAHHEETQRVPTAPQPATGTGAGTGAQNEQPELSDGQIVFFLANFQLPLADEEEAARRLAFLDHGLARRGGKLLPEERTVLYDAADDLLLTNDPGVARAVFEHAEEQLSKLLSSGRWTLTMVEPLLEALARTGDTLGIAELPLEA